MRDLDCTLQVQCSISLASASIEGGKSMLTRHVSRRMRTREARKSLVNEEVNARMRIITRGLRKEEKVHDSHSQQLMSCSICHDYNRFFFLVVIFTELLHHHHCSLPCTTSLTDIINSEFLSYLFLLG